MPYYPYPKTNFRPHRPVRSFRDLEVYQKALEGAVATAKNIIPILKAQDYPLTKEMLECSLKIPLWISQAHSARFEEKNGLEMLEKAMGLCNQMAVYLEEVRDIYSDELERILLEELIKKYIYNRRKLFNLYKSWKKFEKIN